MKKRFTAFLLLLAVSLAGCAANNAGDAVISDSRVYAPSVYDNVDSPYNDKIASGMNGGETAAAGGDTEAPDNFGGADNTETTAEKSGSPDTVIHFLAAGDNIIHSNVYEDALSRATGAEGDPEYNFTDMYDDVADMFRSADISYINQEGMMAGEDYGYSGYPNFNGPQAMGDTIVDDLGFDIVNIANNHMLDKWESGLIDTTEYFESKNCLLIGSYSSAADYDDVRVYDYNGVRIALLSYTYSTNGMYLPATSERVIPLFDADTIVRQIAIAKERADLVFVSAHWGIEDSFTASSDQKYYAQLMVDNGVDVIIGMHPHVLEPMEWAENSEGHKTLITYSIGNLISTMLYSRNMVGGVLTFDIVRTNGEYSIENPLLTPIVCHYNSSRRGLEVYKLENYTAELCAAHGSQKYGSFDLDTLKKYVTDTIGTQFLPDWIK
ncbi:MAG: CapA family protein [Eubacteriales bacterium]